MLIKLFGLLRLKLNLDPQEKHKNEKKEGKGYLQNELEIKFQFHYLKLARQISIASTLSVVFSSSFFML